MRQKANGWRVRLSEEIKTTKNGRFVTLTFNDGSILQIAKEIKDAEGYQLDNAIATYAVRHFLERHRKKYKKSIRHFLVTELGHEGTENIHLHGILFTNITYEELNRLWKYGYVWDSAKNNGFVNQSTVNYITKYITKMDEQHKLYTPKILTSSGIGAGYLNSMEAQKHRNNKGTEQPTYRTATGHKMALPTYYKNKLYTEKEKEEIWKALLDKETRYVLKQEISTKGDFRNYQSALKNARKLNKELGYGDDQKTWEQEQYENSQRRIRQQVRMERARKRKEE